ncbi:hypothetical protein niasHS_010980 [Heterodera schachtii]|uniref:Uncharacterized protein n=1 Tax=Heterodera schachtii TaxID=97005 RepID=A0ABD2J6G7_HETSC
MIRATIAEYFNGLISSVQGVIVLHKIDNPPRNNVKAVQQKRLHQNAVNVHQTVLENRRQREHDKKFGKTVQNEVVDRNSTLKRVFRCIFVNIASVLLVLALTLFIDLIGPSFFSKFIKYLGSLLLVPIFGTVRLLSILWFADVASAALKYRGQFGQKITDLSHAASDFVHAIFLELIFLLQAMFIISIEVPILSNCLGFVYMSLLHSLYSFDYIWMSNGVTLNSRLALIERRWPFHLGFGTILTLATSFSDNFFINGCIFGALFPFFIISSCLTDTNRSTDLSLKMNFTALLSKPCFHTFPSCSKRFSYTLSVFHSLPSRFSRLRLFRGESQKNYATAENKRPSRHLKDLTLRELREIATLAYPHRKRILAGLCCLCVSSVIFLSVPRILGKLMDEMNKEKEKKSDFISKLVRLLKENPFALLVMLIVGAGAIGLRAYLMHTAGQLVVNDLRTKVFNSVLRQDMAFFDRNKVGEIVSRLSTDAFVVGYSVSTNLSEGIRAIFTLLGSTGLMFYTSPDLFKMGTVVIPFVVGAFYKFGKKQRYYTFQMQEAVSNTNQLASERLSNVKTVKIFSAEAKELQSYKNKIMEIWEISKKEGTTKGLMFGGFQLTGYLALTSMLYYGSVLIADGCLTYGDLSSFMLYSALCFGGITNFQLFYTELMRGLGASARIFELRDQKPSISTEGGLVINALNKEVRFESVAFSYMNRESIFSDITFRIPKASVTAIVGASGSGKSTIAHLLLRLYSPTAGRIMIDDIDLKQLDLSSWRRMIGTVSQEPILFSTSIRDNILYGVENSHLITDEELTEAAEQSNCLEFIRSFPNGFDTVLGEHGSSMLSGGQRQRIAIARALIKKPRLLILDEATSALDATSEYLVRKALDALLAKSGQTVLIIAHRLSTIKHADQIVVLDKGTVAELGTFDQLMAIKDGIFFRLVEKQTFDWRNEKF